MRDGGFHTLLTAVFCEKGIYYFNILIKSMKMFFISK